MENSETSWRPDWDRYYLGLAATVSMRADCTRRKVGAVIADMATHDIIQTGYNGTVSGRPGCLAGACPRGRHYRSITKGGPPSLAGATATFGKMCGCGNDWPCPDAVEPGSSYDTGPGECIAVHAEANALLRAGKAARGCNMYLTDEPCKGCKKLIGAAGIKWVYWQTWPYNMQRWTP